MATLRMSSAVRRSQHAFHTAQRNNVRQFSSSPLHQALVAPEGEGGTKASDHSSAVSKPNKSEENGSSSDPGYGESSSSDAGGAMSGDIKLSGNKDTGTGKSRGMATGDPSGERGKKGSGTKSGGTASVA